MEKRLHRQMTTASHLMTLCPRCGAKIDWFGESSNARCSVCKNLINGMNVSDEHEQRTFDRRYLEVLEGLDNGQRQAYYEGRNISYTVKPDKENPYDINHPHHRYWNAGFHKAKFNVLNQ